MTLALLLRRTLVALLVVAAFEVAARETGWRDPTLADDLYLGLAGTPPLFRAETDEQGRAVLRRSPNKTNYRDDTFTAVKPADEFRVFVIGGSGVRCETFQNPDASFARMLEMYLVGLLEGRRPNVVNCGGGGMGSSQNLEVLREVLDHAPDLLLVYPEGGEKNLIPPAPQGVLAMKDDAAPLRADARRLLADLRVYGLVRDAWNGLMPPEVKARKDPSAFSAFALSIAATPFTPSTFTRLVEFKHDRVPPLMEHPLPAEVIEAGHARFRRNLRTMAELCRERGVPLLFAQPVRNLRADFYLRFHVDPDEILPGREDEWRRAYEAGLAAKRARNWTRAIADLSAVRACYVEDQDEILAFYLAECHERLGHLDAAREEYARPYLRHPMRGLLPEVAAETGVPYVDPFPQVQAIASDGIPGFDEFTDSFHPQPATNRVIARTIVDGLRGMDLGAPQRAADDPALRRADVEVRKLVERWPPPMPNRVHKAVIEGRWEDVVELAASVKPETLTVQQLVPATDLGLALTHLGRMDEARRLHGAMRRILWRPGLRPPPLETDEDIVINAFARDVFAWF